MDKVIENFRLRHTSHNLECERFYNVCPICQIIAYEQTDKFLSAIEEAFKPIVSRYWNHWETHGYSIADNTQGEILSGHLAFTCFTDWITPKFYEIDVLDEELRVHPYVRAAIERLK